MKEITELELHEKFEEILEDVVENNATYLITTEENKQIVLLPYEEYVWLKSCYNEWLDQK